MPEFKLGKLPARPDAVTFKFSKYIIKRALPKPPASFGHETLIPPNAWKVLGNNRWGDCVFAGAAHETMLWNKIAGRIVTFTDQAVLSDYSKVTGFDPKHPDTDQGTDMGMAASFRRKTGVIDSKGVRHKVAAYVSLKAGDLTELWQASYLFNQIGVGIEFPDYAMDQFNAGKIWDVKSRGSIEGGHYIPGNARRDGNLKLVTWGREHAMTPRFYSKFNDETVAYISEEAMISHKSAEGFDYAALMKDLQALGA